MDAIALVFAEPYRDLSKFLVVSRELARESGELDFMLHSLLESIRVFLAKYIA